MPGELMKKRVEDVLKMSSEELKVALPEMLDEMRRYGVSKALEEVPDVFSRLIKKFIEIDAAKFLSDVPGVSDMFMGLLWEGVSHLAGSVEELKSAVDKTARDMHVNIEASDSPFCAHFVVSKGKLSGHSGLLHFKDEDYRFMGPTEVLMELLIGELPLGFSNLRLQTAGHSGFVPFVAPVIRGISQSIKGK